MSIARAALAALVTCVLTSGSWAQVRRADPAPGGELELTLESIPPLLSPLEPEPVGGDPEVRTRNIAAMRKDLAALKTFHWNMKVHAGKLEAAGRQEEAEKARETIKTYTGYLKETRARLHGYGVDTRTPHRGLKPIPPLAPMTFDLAVPTDGSPEAEARRRAAAAESAARNVKALSKYADDLDGYMAAADDVLDDEERKRLQGLVEENARRLAEERRKLEESGAEGK